jgi:hypothetical protein
MSYRIRYVSDGGPVHADNVHGWPTHGKTHRTLMGALKAMRDAINSDERIGKSLGVALQFRLCAGAPWHWISARATDKNATDLRIRDWKPLCKVTS